jgi:tetratricopeptide (TPR) repeat protein
MKNTTKTVYPMRFSFLFPSFILINFFASAQADSSNYFLQRGLQEKEKGRRMESLRNFEKAAKYDAKNKVLLNEMALAYVDTRDYYRARETYKKLIDIGETSAQNYKQLVQLSYNLKQYDDVTNYADKLRKADPSEKLNFMLGKVNYEKENYGDAIKYLVEAMKDDPKNAEAPYMIARSYADMMTYKLAIPYFLKAIELDPAQNRWIYEMALIYYAMNDNKNALKYMLDAGDKGYKKDNEYMENLGIAYLNAGKIDEGIIVISDLLKKRPTDVNLMNMAAEAFYNKGKYDQAMDYWDQILGLDKTNASALYMIGMCYLKKGEKEKGTKLCDRAIQMDPSLAAYKQKREMNF